ncbi:Hsp20/alpha crystallin family protein [Acidicapsa ligni]|uniref:Hsp20/alpha crystallin family protein n=1 Tax=Acidicapsa ligni TaxID=542300 RepID=UPI0021DFBA52|nr:Hsp20/alpha crystallin family protein [Acidicapsa ligni]
MFIRRLYPIRENAALQSRVNSFFQDLAKEGSATENGSEVAGTFVPAVDIYDNGEKVVLKLEIPGVKEEDVDIRIENQTLSVRGERKYEAEEKQENFQRVERHYGSFHRSFSLPISVDAENVGATYEAGVLKLELKKKASAQPRQIKIGAVVGAAAGAAAGVAA